MNRTLIGWLFPLLLLDAPDSGSGGGPGDVSDIPFGQSGDVKILEGAPEEEEDSDEGAEDGEDGEEEEGEDGPEEFDTINEEEDDKGEDKEGKEEKEDEEEEGEDKPFEGRPTLTDIKTKYPKIFKEFPELREVLFREQKFSENFGSVEEAQEAAVKAQSFNTIEAALLAGDVNPIIQQLGANAPNSLAQVVDNFLPTVMKASQDLYLRATIPVIEQFLFTAYEHGKSTNDANLMRSAQHAANFIFGKPEIPDPSRRTGNKGPHPAEQKLEEERRTWAETRFREASSEVSAEIDTELESEILKGLDPGKKLSERQRSRLIQDIKDEIDKNLGKDEAFKRQMKGLWTKAGAANYPKDQRASIKSAFLARAKALVPSVRTRLRAEWFGEKLPNSGEKNPDKNKGQQLTRKRVIPDSGRVASGKGTRPPSSKEVDYSKTSDLDLIEGRFSRKR